jgi:LacI family transcriptional regulator
MANKFVRIKDVAEYCGVSVPTVSDVLNGKAKQKRISAATAEKVLAAAKQLNYKVNLQARNMAKGRSYTVGAVFCRLDNPFYSKIFHGFYDECINNSCSPLVFISDWDQEKEKKAIDQLTGMRVDGIVISPACTVASKSNLEMLVKQKIPLCIFEQGAVEEADFIGFDNYAGIFDAVTMLAAKGYKKIKIALRKNYSLATEQRLAGFKAGLEAAGLPLDEKMLFYIDENGQHKLDYMQSGYENMLSVLGASDRPEAMIALNDEFALGAYHAARELNMKIPDDIAIVGYGDREFATHVFPGLTTLKQDLDALGRKIGSQLFARIENKESAIVNEFIRTPLIERGSC